MLSEIILLMLVCLEYFISNTMKCTSIHKAFSICSAAQEYLLCHEGTSMVQSCGAAWGWLWLSPWKGTASQDHVPPPSGHQGEEEVVCLLTNGAGRYSSVLHSPHLQQHMIMRKSKLLRLRDF